MSEPEPGSFRGIEEVECDPYRKVHPTPSHTKGVLYERAYFAAADSVLAEAMQQVTECFGVPKKVLYPACGAHVIDTLFPESEIVYVDPCETGIQLISAVMSKRARALSLPIEQLPDGEEFDLLFSLNSHAPMAEQLRRLKKSGLIFCNNYFGTQDAEAVFDSSFCDLIGVIEQGSETETVLLSPAPAEYGEIDPSLPESEIGSRRKKVALYYIFRKKCLEE